MTVILGQTLNGGQETVPTGPLPRIPWGSITGTELWLQDIDPCQCELESVGGSPLFVLLALKGKARAAITKENEAGFWVVRALRKALVSVEAPGLAL